MVIFDHVLLANSAQSFSVFLDFSGMGALQRQSAKGTKINSLAKINGLAQINSLVQINGVVEIKGVAEINGLVQINGIGEINVVA